MIRTLILSMIFSFNAYAGIQVNVPTKKFQIYTFDSSRVVLKDLKNKQKWVMSRELWTEKPSIGNKVKLSKFYIKKLKKYKSN